MGKKKGQTKDIPQDGLYKFYTSLLKQNPNSKMAMKWCLEHGLVPEKDIDSITKKIQKLKITKKKTT